MSEIILTSENFEEVVIQSNKPVLVDFWAPWCGPCGTMSPIVDELAKEMDTVVVSKLNVDDCQDVAQRYNILSVPTFIVFKGGQIVEQFSGTMTKDALRERVEKHA